MQVTESINIFNNRSIDKNATIVLATPISLRNCGPETLFWVDLNASGGGDVVATYQVGDTPDETFYTPGSAEAIHTLFKSSIGNASRDRFAVAIMGTPWIKFQLEENNASPVDVSMDLIISRDR